MSDINSQIESEMITVVIPGTTEDTENYPDEVVALSPLACSNGHPVPSDVPTKGGLIYTCAECGDELTGEELEQQRVLAQ